MQCQVWSCLSERFSRQLQVAIPEAKQLAHSERACFERALHYSGWIFHFHSHSYAGNCSKAQKSKQMLYCEIVVIISWISSNLNSRIVHLWSNDYKHLSCPSALELDIESLGFLEWRPQRKDYNITKHTAQSHDKNKLDGDVLNLGLWVF